MSGYSLQHQIFQSEWEAEQISEVLKEKYNIKSECPIDIMYEIIGKREKTIEGKPHLLLPKLEFEFMLNLIYTLGVDNGILLAYINRLQEESNKRESSLEKSGYVAISMMIDKGQILILPPYSPELF